MLFNFNLIFIFHYNYNSTSFCSLAFLFTILLFCINVLNHKWLGLHSNIRPCSVTSKKVLCSPWKVNWTNFLNECTSLNFHELQKLSLGQGCHGSGFPKINGHNAEMDSGSYQSIIVHSHKANNFIYHNILWAACGKRKVVISRKLLALIK